MRLFGRKAKVSFSLPTGFFSQGATTVEVEDLRIAFQINKDLGGQPNTCSLVIYNLDEASWSEVQRKKLHVRVEAGYIDDMHQIFVGDLRWATTSLQNVDQVAEFQIGDGERAVNYARVSRPLRSGSTAKAALNEVAQSMGFSVPTSIAGARELLTQFAGGISLSGPSAAKMTALLKPHDMSWSIQDNQLQILRRDEASPNQAFVVSEDEGMIGVPEVSPPDGKGGKPLTTVRMLLHPRILPGARLQIESSAVRGTFRVNRVAHRGDTHDASWETEIEAQPL